MQNMTRRAVVAALSLAAAVAMSSCAPKQEGDSLYEAAKKEGVVNWYTGLLRQQLVDPLVAGFEARYPGVRVEIVGGQDTELLATIRSQVNAGKLEADLIDGPSMASSIIADGLAEPYVPANAADVPAQYKDADGLWTAPTLFFITTSYNTNLVKAGEEPKTLQDLLDPKWRGKMAWSGELTTAGPVGFIGGILQQMGEEQGTEYLKKLAAQQITTIPDNARVVMNKVIAGDYAIGLATYNHHAAGSKAKGEPIEWMPLEPVVATMARSMLLKGGPHPNSAKLLLDYLFSVEGQQVIREAGYIPSVASLAPKDEALKLNVDTIKVFAPTPAQEAAGMQKWVDLYHQLFLPDAA